MRILLTLLILTPPLLAQEKEKAWTNKIDLAATLTSGNSEASNISLADAYSWANEKSSFKLNFSAIRAEDARITYIATGTEDAFEISEDKDKELSAENYHIDMTYNRKFSERTGWFTSLDWTRDEIAGVEGRTGIAAGLTNNWIETDTHKLSISYGAKLVMESNTFERQGFDDTYPALTAVLDQSLTVTKTTSYAQKLSLDANTEESDDWQGNWNHSLSVSVSNRIAVKLGLTLKYDNDPAYEGVALQGTDLVIPYQLDELDTIFTSAIVINM